VLLACLGAVGTSPAEVSVVPQGTSTSTLVLASVVDDPNPIGIWLAYRAVSAELVLNPDGHARGDGRPDIAWNTASWPLVVWAYDGGVESDIAFAEWDGARWTPTEFLAATPADERDPRIFVEADGAVLVTWWTAQPEDVWLVRRPGGSTAWDPPVLVTAGAESGRRPSVAALDGVTLVAFERDSAQPGAAREVRVAAAPPEDGFTFQTLAATLWSAPLDPLLHVEQGHVWADWMHAPGEIGCAERQATGSWTAGPPAAWVDPSWTGLEQARRAVRGQILD
jgi:hypothetical protein